MRRAKEQKGITLIALIITIIVLLILAVVAIGAVQNDGIINHAKNAREEYGKAGVNENTTLQAYLDKIKDNIPTGVGTGTGTGGNQGTNITFTIDGTWYTVADGMTWGEWINSKDYDSGDWEVVGIYADGSLETTYIRMNGTKKYLCGPRESRVNADSQIIHKNTYITCTFETVN